MGALQGLQRNDETARQTAPRSVAPGKSQGAGQHTLKNAIHCSGVGLHSGAKVAMTLHPAPANHGIVFRRQDLPGQPELAARCENAVETPLCTTLEADGVRVATIEHLMSGLAGCGVDNAVVELDGPEVPIMDGSAAPFVFLIECAGMVEQAVPRRAIRILKEIAIEDGGRVAALRPGYGFWVDFEIDFNSQVIARQSWSARLTRQQFKCELSRARTFGFLQEVDSLREMGLAQGGSLDNAVVVSHDGVMNEGGLRYDDEFVRHKVLDSLGDLYLAGAPIVGHFHAVKSGHAMNLRLLRALFADPSAWCWSNVSASEAGLVESDGASVPPARAVAARA